MSEYGNAGRGAVGAIAIKQEGDLAVILHRLESLRSEARIVRLKAEELNDRLFGPTPEKAGSEKGTPPSPGGFYPAAQVFIEHAAAEMASAQAMLSRIVRSLE